MRRRPGRMVGVALGTALAVCSLASLGAFFTASRAQMTEQATRGVPVDWQVQLQPGTDVSKAERTIAGAPGVHVIRSVGYADVPRFRSNSGGTVQVTGTGKALGLTADYSSVFPGVLRPLVGARAGVLLAQQTAANLHVAPGDTISIGRPGMPAGQVKVDGVVDLPTADSLFQAVGVPAGAAPKAPPDNVILLPLGEWHRLFDPVARSRPGAVRVQVHVKLDRTLPPDPGAAFAQAVGRAHNLEAQLAGAGRVGNNLGAQLDAARSDAVYSELLFLFLGLPGVIVAALITAVVGATGRGRRRREYALLRARGASPRIITRLAAAEAALAGVLGSVVGLAGAALVGRLAFGTARFGATDGQALLWALVAVLSGLALAFTAIMIPSRRDARGLTVRAARAAVGSSAPPLWERMYLDVALLLGAGLLFWQAVSNGYQVVLAPEGVPTISISYFTLLGPAMLWAGSALFIWRIAGVVLGRGRGAVATLTRPVAHGLSRVVAASMARQRRLLGRGLVITALAVSFALSTAVFDTTYRAQARVDAQLTNGADVSVTTPASAGLTGGLTARVRSLQGVADAQPMQHRFAYVGNDLQDLYGIDPATIGRATNMSDAFFASGNARAALAALPARPDGVLVSDETVHDFQLQPGDLVRLRLQFASDHAYHIVPFHYVGVVREFPTAPRDSFLVANSSYVAAKTGTPAFQTLLVRTSASPPAVAAEVRSVLPPASGARVQDVVSELRVTLSGLTAIDLSGLIRLELVLALVLAVASSGLVLALGLAERRRTFAIATALGARPGQLAAFVWSEAAFVTVGGLILGALAGWGIAFAVVKILTGVFDPPPQHLSWPWLYLGVVAATTVAAVTVAGVGFLRATRGPVTRLVREL